MKGSLFAYIAEVTTVIYIDIADEMTIVCIDIGH